jgi:hypothetical protein
MPARRRSPATFAVTAVAALALLAASVPAALALSSSEPKPGAREGAAKPSAAPPTPRTAKVRICNSSAYLTSFGLEGPSPRQDDLLTGGDCTDLAPMRPGRYEVVLRRITGKAPFQPYVLQVIREDRFRYLPYDEPERVRINIAAGDSVELRALTP